SRSPERSSRTNEARCRPWEKRRRTWQRRGRSSERNRRIEARCRRTTGKRIKHAGAREIPCDTARLPAIPDRPRADPTGGAAMASVQHVFVLMLENRSFDHMLGSSRLRGIDHETGAERPVRGLTGAEANLVDGQRHVAGPGALPVVRVDPG